MFVYYQGMLEKMLEHYTTRIGVMQSSVASHANLTHLNSINNQKGELQHLIQVNFEPSGDCDSAFLNCLVWLDKINR